MGSGDFKDKRGLKITKNYVVKNQTDDGLLAAVDWDKRHHVSPSNFNSQNKSYYKVIDILIIIGFFRNFLINLLGGGKILH
jgi:hypothetical protein